MSYALVQRIDESSYHVIGSKFLKKNGSIHTFKLKDFPEVIACKITAFNDERHMLTNIAKALNLHLPQVDLDNDLNESIRSQLLSYSYVNDSRSESNNSNINETPKFEYASVIQKGPTVRRSLNKSLDFETIDINSIPIYYDNEHCQLIDNNVVIEIIDESRVNKIAEYENGVNNINASNSNLRSEPERNPVPQHLEVAIPESEDLHEQNFGQDESEWLPTGSDTEDSDSELDYDGSFEKPSTSKLPNVNVGSSIQVNTKKAIDKKTVDKGQRRFVDCSTDRLKTKSVNTGVEPDQNIESDVPSINYTQKKLPARETTPTNLYESEDSENEYDENPKRVTRNSKRRKNQCSENINKDKDKLDIDESGKIILDGLNKNIIGSPRVDPKTKFVPRSNVTKKRESKVHVCFYCGEKIIDKIKRHLLNVHKDEKLVVQASGFEKDVQAKVITILINLGDYNANVTNSDEGELYGTRRLNKKQIIKGKLDEKTGEYVFSKTINASNATILLKDTDNGPIPVLHNYELPKEEVGDLYVPCSNCFKYLKKSYLRKHNCPIGDKIPQSKGILKESENLIPDIHPLASTRLRDLVIKRMHPGEIKDIVKKDKFIVMYGNDLVDYYNKDQNYSMISHQLRTLAELLKTIRDKNNTIKHFSDVLSSRENANIITESMKDMAQHDETNGLVAKGHKIPEIVTLLNKFIKFFRNHFIEVHQDNRELELKKLKGVLKGKFKNLNKKSRDSIVEQAKEKPIVKLPTAEDINKLYRYTEKIRATAFETLQNGFDRDAFRDLNESTLLLMQIFNRKRQGEISRLLKSDMRKSAMYKLDQENSGVEYKKLSDKSKAAAQEYVRISILNKKGLRTAGLLIHQRLLDSVNLIMLHRPDSLKENKYVFAKESNNKSLDAYYQAYIIMRTYANKCGVKDSSTLRGTMLRKQIATMVYAADIQDKNLQDLANFLGHELKIHLNYYRQQIPARELINITPLLEHAQGTNSNDGKNNEEDDEVNSREVCEETDEDEYSDSDYEAPEEECNENQRKNFFQKENIEKQEKRIKKITESAKRKRNNSYAEVDEPKPKKGKLTWTDEEKKAVKSFIAQNPLPSRINAMYLENMKTVYPILKGRDIPTLRAHIHNELRNKGAQTMSQD